MYIIYKPATYILYIIYWTSLGWKPSNQKEFYGDVTIFNSRDKIFLDILAGPWCGSLGAKFYILKQNLELFIFFLVLLYNF